MTPARLFGLIVILLNFASAFAVISQVRLTYRRKNIVGLSRVPWFMSTSNNVFGLLYSVLVGDIVYLLANLVWLLVNGAMLGLVLYYGRGAAKPTGVEQP